MRMRGRKWLPEKGKEKRRRYFHFGLYLTRTEGVKVGTPKRGDFLGLKLRRGWDIEAALVELRGTGMVVGLEAARRRGFGIVVEGGLGGGL